MVSALLTSLILTFFLISDGKVMADSLFNETLKRAATENAALVDPAASTSSAVEKPGISNLAKGLYAGGAGADIGSTLYGFAHGRGESNPLINWAPKSAMLPIGAGIELAAILLGKKLLGDKHPKILNALVGGAGLVHGGFAANNIRKFNTGPATPTSISGNLGELLNR